MPPLGAIVQQADPATVPEEAAPALRQDRAPAFSPGESGTDGAAVEGMTEEEIELASPPTPTTSVNRSDWPQAVRGIPPRGRDIHIQIDEDVLGWFRQGGRGYPTGITNVLRALVGCRKRAPR
jgi:uncharacterized protein (DUF4415 family)